MLRTATQIRGFKIQDSVGKDVGSVKDIYLDDAKWAIRYVVADVSGSLFEDKKVLISPYSVSGIGWAKKTVWVNLSADHIRSAPSADTEKPVARRLEELYSAHFALPRYWEGRGLWPGGIYPAAYVAASLAAVPPPPPMLEKEADFESEPMKGQIDLIRQSHLRSMDEILGYCLRSSDQQKFGEVEDLILEEESWAIRYLIVKDSLGWFKNRRLLVSPAWFSGIGWEERVFDTPFSRAQVESCPEYKSNMAIEFALEEALHQHFRQPPYWRGSVSAARRDEAGSEREPEL